MKRILVMGLVTLGMLTGCAGTQTASEVSIEPAAAVVPKGKVVTGMSRQDVIVSLGPPILVTRKSGEDTEFLVYHLPSADGGNQEQRPLYIAIDDGKVSATGTASDFGFDQ